MVVIRIQFIPEERITHPRDAKAACRDYVRKRCAFAFLATPDAADARRLANDLKAQLRPTLNL